VIVKTVLAVTN